MSVTPIHKIVVNILFVLTILFFTGCERTNDKSFSQLPGFKSYFEKHPPSPSLPKPIDQELLNRFKPALYIPEGHEGPVDFYKDYISNGYLKNDKHVISKSVTKELLNRFKDEYGAVFIYENPCCTQPTPVAYGRIDRRALYYSENGKTMQMHFTFLVYNFVFKSSGPVAGIPFWQNTVLDFFFDLNDWHQLDHYTAVTIVLEGQDTTSSTPIAVMLQQHDNVRTYIVGEGIELSEEGRVEVDAAIRSNELYPHRRDRGKYRAARFPDYKSLHFLISGKDKPLFAGYDITDSEKEAEYTLKFLPPDDAFYTFKGYLGEQRLLPGRDAPPGAYYNVIPELMPLEVQLGFGYWREGNSDDLERLKTYIKDNNDYRGYAIAQGNEFLKRLIKLVKQLD